MDKNQLIELTDNIPKELGYKMPPEWTSHSATQLHWPHNRSTWPGKTLAAVERVYVQIIATLTISEPVYVIAADEKIKHRAQQTIEESEYVVKQDNLKWMVFPLNDIWARDCGPIFIQNEDRQTTILDWEYNAWGEKYPPYDQDNRIPQRIANEFNVPIISPGMVLEGGSIDVNGKGDLLTTESVLLNPNRNPTLSKTDIEDRLRSYLGVENIIWLHKGLVGDDTDGHIDDLARFINNDTILTVRAEQKSDPNYEILEENYKRLKQARSVDGSSFNVECLPLPETRSHLPTADGSEYVPASYVNFYIGNKVVLVPTYDQRYDDEVLKRFETYFSSRDIVGISSRDLVWGQGAIHCITQQWYGI